MEKNIVERGRLQMTIRRMRCAHSIPKATNTHAEYLLLLPLQQWLRERPSLLHYTCIACLTASAVRKVCLYTYVIKKEREAG